MDRIYGFQSEVHIKSAGAMPSNVQIQYQANASYRSRVPQFHLFSMGTIYSPRGN